MKTSVFSKATHRLTAYFHILPRTYVRCAVYLLLCCGVTSCASTSQTYPQSNDATKTESEQYNNVKQSLAEWKEMKPSLDRLVALESDLKMLIDIIVANDVDRTDARESDKSLSASVPEPTSSPQKMNTAPVSTGKTLTIIQPTSPSKITPLNSVQPESLSLSMTSTQAKAPVVHKPEMAPEPYIDTAPNSDTKTHNLKSAMRLTGPSSTVGLHLASYKNPKNLSPGWKGIQKKYYEELKEKKAIYQEVLVKGAKFYSLRVGPFTSRENAEKVCLFLNSKRQYCSLTQYKGKDVNTL